MPHRCGVCKHPKRRLFEKRVRAEEPIAWIAGELGLSRDAAYRHARFHMTDRAKARQAAESAERATQVAESDPARTFHEAFGVEPLEWQVPFLGETRDTVLLKGRQIGATQCAGALAIDTARSKPASLTAIISPTLNQSKEITLRARLGLMTLGEKLDQDSIQVLRLQNGSRIVSLPGTDRSVRGYPADLLIVDEAAWVEEMTWTAARATVAATGGRIVVQSTPGVPAGWFFRLATDTPDGWASYVVRSDEVKTIKREKLEQERRELPPELFAQEYMAEFTLGAGAGRWFSEEGYEERVDKRFPAIE